jgi:hypothetical protein
VNGQTAIIVTFNNTSIPTIDAIGAACSLTVMPTITIDSVKKTTTSATVQVVPNVIIDIATDTTAQT